MFARNVLKAVVCASAPERRSEAASVFNVRHGVGLAAALSVLTFTLGAGDARAADSCPNAQLRTGASAALKDCRAYELVSPDSNHGSLGLQPAGHSSEDGQTMIYQTIDAPANASSASVFNVVRAKRDATKGWSGVSLAPPSVGDPTVYLGSLTTGIATDLVSTVEMSDKPLSGGGAPDGQNLFVRQGLGPYKAATIVGSPLIGGLGLYFSPAFLWGTPNFDHIYYQPKVAQVQDDPLTFDNTYSWSAEDGVELVGVLPDGTLAPNGATLAIQQGMLQPASDDGKYVVFVADGLLYLRVKGAPTVAVTTSRRTPVDINPEAAPGQAGLTADGAKVLFTSQNELTDDANTGRTGGVSTDAGRDLYSYDIGANTLTDLTPDTNPADVATGANVQRVAAATPDGSYIYFTATGQLAGGASPGHTSLYVWHDGRIDFVADADGLTIDSNTGDTSLYVTPNGRHIAFGSTDRLTGYDNTDQVTGEAQAQVFTYTLGGTVKCASCRPDGSRPTGRSSLPIYSGLPPNKRLRKMSDDGKRVFFSSDDSVLPQTSIGRRHIFEYADGKVSPISNLDATSDATFLDASPSGDDVFFATYDELVPNPYGGDSAVYDARVNGGIPPAVSRRCAGVACQDPATPAPALASAGTVVFFGDDEADTSSDPAGTSKVTVSKLTTIKGTTGSLKVKVPGKGRLTVSGSGLTTKRSNPSKAQTITVRLALTSAATKTLKRKRSFKTKVKVAFVDSAGQASTATLSLTFKAAAAGKGR